MPDPKRTDDICTEVGTVVIAAWVIAVCLGCLTVMALILFVRLLT